MSAEIEARDFREQRLHDALDDVIRHAFTSNIARAAREYVAEEDFDAMLEAIVGALDEAGLYVTRGATSVLEKESELRQALARVRADQSPFGFRSVPLSPYTLEALLDVAFPPAEVTP